MSRQQVLIRLFLSFSLAAFFVYFTIWYLEREPTLGGDFTLNHQGQAWNFSDHQKPLNVLYIGYAQCPDVCPMSLSYASQAFRQLAPKELDRAQMLFLSVDHENDTPQAVAQYAQQFFEPFIGLTGSKEQIDEAVELFGASYIVEKDEDSHLGYSIAHTDRLFFLDHKGHVVSMIRNPRSAELIIQEIRKNL